MDNIKKGYFESYGNFILLNFIKMDYLEDIKTKYYNLFDKNLSKSDNIGLGDKVYFTPDIEFPRYKFRAFGENVGAERTIKINKANVIIIKRESFTEFLAMYAHGNSRWNNSADSDFIEKPNSKPATVTIEANTFIKPKDLMNIPKGNIYRKFILNDEMLKKLEIFDYMVNNASKFTFVDVVDLQSEVSSITGVQVDTNTINTIIDLLKSTDQGNVDLGKEMMCNLKIKEAPFTCYYLCKLFNHKLKYGRNVSLNAFYNALSNLTNKRFQDEDHECYIQRDFTEETLREFYNNEVLRVPRTVQLLTDFDKNFILERMTNDLCNNLILKDLNIELKFKEKEPQEDVQKLQEELSN